MYSVRTSLTSIKDSDVYPGTRSLLVVLLAAACAPSDQRTRDRFRQWTLVLSSKVSACFSTFSGDTILSVEKCPWLTHSLLSPHTPRRSCAANAKSAHAGPAAPSSIDVR